MDKDILLSIIIPVYNTQNLLSECIESVLSQDSIGEDIEILLINDGSSDDSRKICDEYAKNHSTIKVFHKENGGLSDARNYGMKRSSGKFIVFLDSDDLWEQGYINEIRKITSKKPDVELIFGNYIQYFPKTDKKIYPDNFLAHENITDKTGIEILEMILNNENHQCISSACKNIYSKDLLLKNEIYFKKGLLAEDAFWSPNVYFKAQKCDVLKSSYYCYRRQREKSITNIFKTKLLSDIIYICNYWIDFIEKSDYNDNFKQLFINEYAVHFRNNLQKIYTSSFKNRKNAVNIAKENLHILKKSSKPGHIKLYKLIFKIGLRPALLILNIRFRYWRLRKTT